MIIFGPAKHGKSWMGDTTPAPRLVLDAEGGSRFTPSKKVLWDPSQPPPVYDGSWDSAIVYVREYRTVLRAYEWLNSGKHPFNSVVLDSISEIQQRSVDDLVGPEQMRTQDWGALLRVVSDLVRKFRDLNTNPIRPLDAVVFIAMAKEVEGVWRPHIQGQLGITFPYYVDVCSYLAIVNRDDGVPVHRLYVAPATGFVTGERVGGRLGPYLDNPSISSMIEMVRGDDGAPPLPMAVPPSSPPPMQDAIPATTEQSYEEG